MQRRVQGLRGDPSPVVPAFVLVLEAVSLATGRRIHCGTSQGVFILGVACGRFLGWRQKIYQGVQPDVKTMTGRHQCEKPPNATRTSSRTSLEISSCCAACNVSTQSHKSQTKGSTQKWLRWTLPQKGKCPNRISPLNRGLSCCGAQTEHEMLRPFKTNNIRAVPCSR